MSSKTLHPQIYSLLALKDEGRAHMIAGRFYKALKVMRYLCVEISREDRDEELVKKINRAIATLDSFRYQDGTARSKHRKDMKPQYLSWWDDVFYILDTKGYMTNQKYGFTIEEDGKKFG